MEQTSVTIGVDNDNYVEIVSGLNEGDQAYVVSKTTATDGGLLAGLFSSLGGTGSTQQSSGTPDMSNFPSDFGGGNMPNFSGGSGMGGGGFGGNRSR